MRLLVLVVLMLVLHDLLLFGDRRRPLWEARHRGLMINRLFHFVIVGLRARRPCVLCDLGRGLGGPVLLPLLLAEALRRGSRLIQLICG